MSIPETITLGHVLALGAAIALLAAIVEAVRWWRYRGHGRGTPGYARARTARRAALYAVAIAILLCGIGCFTPAGEMAVAGTAR